MNFSFSFKQSKVLVFTGLFTGASLALAAATAPTPTPTPTPTATPTPTPTVTPTPVLTWDKDIQPIVNDNCSYCHSGADASGALVLETQAEVLAVKAAVISTVSKCQMPLGDTAFCTGADGKKLLDWLAAQGTTPTPTPTPTPVTYDKDIKPIIADNCQGCHTVGAASGGVALDTQADVVKYKKAIAATVAAGTMPRGDKTFKASADAKTLLDWIKSLDTAPKPAI